MVTIRKNLLRSSLWIVQLWLRSQLFVSPASNQRWIILRSPTVLWITWPLLRKLPDYQQKEICGGDVSRIWSEIRETNLNPPRRKRQRLKCTESKRMRWNIDWGNLKTGLHQDRVIGPLHSALHNTTTYTLHNFFYSNFYFTYNTKYWNFTYTTYYFNPNTYYTATHIANSAQTEYCPTFLCVLVRHRRDISSFLDNLTV